MSICTEYIYVDNQRSASHEIVALNGIDILVLVVDRVVVRRSRAMLLIDTPLIY